MPSYYLILLLSLFCLIGCQKKPLIFGPSEELPNGVLVFRRNTNIFNQEFSQKKVLKNLQTKLKKEKLDQNLNLTLSFSRLTIAGQVYSSEDLQKAISLAFEQPEISEIISTVIISGNESEEALL